MGSYTKKMRKQMDEIHGKIVDGYRRGVCDKDGYSEKNAEGVMVARPRTMRDPRSLDPTDTFLERYRKGLVVV